jgi:hypothetical protein
MQRTIQCITDLLRLIFGRQRDEAETASLAGLSIARHGDFFDARTGGLEHPPQLNLAYAFGEARNKELASIRIGHDSRRGGLKAVNC